MHLLRDRSDDLAGAGVRPFGISRDSPWSHRAWAQTLGVEVPLAVDGQLHLPRGRGLGHAEDAVDGADRPLGQPQIGLPQRHAVLAGQAVEPLDGGMHELGVGREGDVLGLHGGVDRDADQIARAQRSARVRHAQALGQQQLELVTQSLTPVAQPRALVREGVLEELLASKELEVWVLDPTLAHLFVR